tara:strand:+ start:3532 stop:4821 length:1290 start_codon:yes stop_codon:yes gene_type:complete
MGFLNRLIINISSLKFAISLLLFIAFASGIGTFIPQGLGSKEYLETYNINPILGLIDGNKILLLELDHVYKSSWFILSLFLLCVSLASSSIRKQIPTLKASLQWLDYDNKDKFNKLQLTNKWEESENSQIINNARNILKKKGWNIQSNENRLSARKGVFGRLGPILVHTGLILLLIGSAYGNFSRKSLEEFLISDESLDLINDISNERFSLKLKDFKIEREDDGIPKQFTSSIEITQNNSNEKMQKTTQVNHPLRYRGVTIYQADWAINNIIIEIDNLQYQFNLKPIPEIGNQIWGVLIELGEKIRKNYLLAIDNENGPVKIFDIEDFTEYDLYLDEKNTEINASKIKLVKIVPSSGLIIKSDPSIPIVYFSFFLIICGASLSIIPTKRIWILKDIETSNIYIGGLCNKNLSGFELEFNDLSKVIKNPN